MSEKVRQELETAIRRDERARWIRWSMLLAWPNRESEWWKGWNSALACIREDIQHSGHEEADDTHVCDDCGTLADDDVTPEGKCAHCGKPALEL